LFTDFHGNSDVVHRLREMLARDRFPQAVVLSGPAGSGKYTLALMLAKAINCLSPITTDGLPDFCGKCSNCLRIAQSEDLDARFEEAVEARENLRETDKKETRLFVQTHPDVLVIPPDPPQMMIKVDQVRRVIETIYYRPGEARERVYIFTESSFMKEAANSLLKVLEEPPQFATIFLLTENPDILVSLAGDRKRPRLVVGFAAETDDVLANARKKRKNKGADWIVANDVSALDGKSVMGGTDNQVTLVRENDEETWEPMSKENVALKLVERIAHELA